MGGSAKTKEDGDSSSYIVKRGDCLASIAFAHGFRLETLWNDDANAGLRESCGDPYTLRVGETVVIPPKTPKVVAVASGRRHRFRLKGVPEKLRIRLTDDDQPRKGLDYQLEVDGISMAGTTDADGWLEEFIPPNAREAVLVLEVPDAEERYELELGALAPATDNEGARDRLINTGRLDPGGSETELRAALRSFQTDQDLDLTGEIDGPTIERLDAFYDSDLEPGGEEESEGEPAEPAASEPAASEPVTSEPAASEATSE